MVRRADAGDMVDRERVPILFEDTAFDVGKKVAGAARLLIARNLDAIAAGTAPGIPQIEEEATLFGRRTPADGKIDWSLDAPEIYNLVRAVTHPFPGALAFREGKKLFIWKALPEECPDDGMPQGTVLSRSPLRVKTGKGCLRILRAQFEGEPEEDGEFLGKTLGEGSLLE